MTVPIDVPAALIVFVSCAVMYVVHRHTRQTSSSVPKHGDLGIAIGAGLATLTALSFLFGVTADRNNADTRRDPTPNTQRGWDPSPSPDGAAIR